MRRRRETGPKRLPKTSCPACGYVMDDATAADGSNVWPEPGDFSLCLRCGEVLVYNGQMTVRRATNAEINELEPAHRAELISYSQLIVREDPLGHRR